MLGKRSIQKMFMAVYMETGRGGESSAFRYPRRTFTAAFGLCDMAESWVDDVQRSGLLMSAHCRGI